MSGDDYNDGFEAARRQSVPIISDMTTMIQDYIINGHINGHLDKGQAKSVLRDAVKFLGEDY